MPAIGKGVEEIRIWDDSGTYRVIYTARLDDAVYVLHAFQKKTQTTAKRDTDLGACRALVVEARIRLCEDRFSTFRRPMVVPWVKERRKYGPHSRIRSPADQRSGRLLTKTRYAELLRGAP